MLIMGKVHKYSLPFANMKHHDKIMTKYAKYTCIHTHVYIYIHIHIHPHKCHSIRQQLCLIPYVYAFNTHGKDQHVCIYIHIYMKVISNQYGSRKCGARTREQPVTYILHIYFRQFNHCGIAEFKNEKPLF